MEITLEEIQKKFASLPEDLQWAIIAAKVDDNIIEIGNKENLTVAQMGQLSLETYMVMFGFTPLDKFEGSVKTSLQLSDEKNRNIVMAINDKILKEVRGHMMDNSAPVEAPQAEPLAITPPSLSEIKRGLPNLNTPELTAPAAKTEIAQAPLENKFSSSFQSSVVKTEHTLNNISKPSETKVSSAIHLPNIPLRTTPGVKTMADIKSAGTGPVKAYTKDPYRLSPEE